jgi:hypothetical protein
MSTNFSDNSPAEQRYYYCVALRGYGVFGNRRVRALLELSPDPVILPEVNASTDFFSWISSEAFGTGEMRNAFRISLPDAPEQYRYDCFSTEFRINGREFVVLGFPFVALGRQLIEKMVVAGLLREAAFVRVNVAKVISAVRSGDVSATLRIAKLVARVEDDAVRRLSLGGRDAIHSEIYGALLSRFGEATFGARSCIVAFRGGDRERASVHMDNYGNFRFWMRAGCKNVGAFASIIQVCTSIGSAAESTAVPHERLAISELLEEESDTA